MIRTNRNRLDGLNSKTAHHCLIIASSLQNQQYQLDIYRSPCHSRCKGLILLETFTTLADEELLASLPPFLRY
jgi:hypothetical protein